MCWATTMRDGKAGAGGIEADVPIPHNSHKKKISGPCRVKLKATGRLMARACRVGLRHLARYLPLLSLFFLLLFLLFLLLFSIQIPPFPPFYLPNHSFSSFFSFQIPPFPSSFPCQFLLLLLLSSSPNYVPASSHHQDVPKKYTKETLITKSVFCRVRF